MDKRIIAQPSGQAGVPGSSGQQELQWRETETTRVSAEMFTSNRSHSLAGHCIAQKVSERNVARAAKSKALAEHLSSLCPALSSETEAERGDTLARAPSHSGLDLQLSQSGRHMGKPAVWQSQLSLPFNCPELCLPAQWGGWLNSPGCHSGCPGHDLQNNL